jgi:hypothetical protein
MIHCCFCDRFCDCKCNEIIALIKPYALNFLKQQNISINDFLFSPCLSINCSAMKKFCETLLATTAYNFDTLLKSKSHYRFLFHGTPNRSNVRQICCSGWEISKRGINGQAHGPGEYFTDYMHTAMNYSGPSGGILLSLVLHESITSALKIKYISSNEKYYIMNNTDTQLYSLPIAVLKVKCDLIGSIVCPKTLSTITQVKGIRFYDEFWREYEPDSISKINAFLSQGLKQFSITTTNNFIYDIDIEKLIQRNRKSGFVRDIIIY